MSYLVYLLIDGIFEELEAAFLPIGSARTYINQDFYFVQNS